MLGSLGTGVANCGMCYTVSWFRRVEEREERPIG